MGSQKPKKVLSRDMKLVDSFAIGAPRDRPIRWALFVALGIVAIQSFLFQISVVPSGSMRPTLLVGDHILISKFAYGFSRYSLPFSVPLISGRVPRGNPKRGDVVVFRSPSDDRTAYVKRLVGLPGDRIQILDGILHINGEPIFRMHAGELVTRTRAGEEQRAPILRETLPNGVRYLTVDSRSDGPYDMTDVFVVPDGHYFVMGDNRDNSLDSRALPDYLSPRQGGVGFVPYEKLVGRAEIIIFSTRGRADLWQVWRWPQEIRFGRLFQAID